MATYRLTVTSKPSRAMVYLRRYAGGLTDAGSTSPTLAGTTPLEREIPRFDYVVRVKKEGYAPLERTISGATMPGLEKLKIFEPPRIDVQLVRVDHAQPGMVFVPGGEYKLCAWRRLTDETVRLEGYWIDKCEVTNSQYQQFVDEGGYRSPRFWTPPFVKDGRTLSWEDAMREMRDSTGSAGPRNWANGQYPEGKAEHPVTDVTWYEAAAYAAFRDKSLPTIFQWEKAARNGVNTPVGVVMPWGLLQEGSTEGRANCSSSGTLPVGSLEFGLSPFGCHDMAGNVAEWCRNETSEGFVTSGGSWGQPIYLFGYYGPYPGFSSSGQLGFRCVWSVAEDESALAVNLDNEVPQYQPEPEETVRAWFSQYDGSSAPLDDRVVDRQETAAWWREKIAFIGADDEQAFAYLYLPKNAKPPYQVVHVVPAGDVAILKRPLPESIEAEQGPLIRSGRAVFSVVLKGYPERVYEWEQDHLFKEQVHRAVDLRRGLDCLFQRGDVDTSRISYLMASAGGVIMTLPAIDTRYGAVILTGAGIRDATVYKRASSVHFIPLIKQPTLLIHGQYDETSPFNTTTQPLWNLLTCRKELRRYEGGHRPAPQYLAREVRAWLDEVLGPAATAQVK